MAVRIEVFDIVGGFRDGIGPNGKSPLGCEETEFCIRANQRWNEKKWIYQPKAIVYHHVAQNRASFRYFIRRCYGEGLSKALVSKYVGAKSGLSVERDYTIQVLPKAIFNGLKDMLSRQDRFGLLRAGAILVGLFATVAGYMAGLILIREQSSRARKQGNPLSEQ